MDMVFNPPKIRLWGLGLFGELCMRIGTGDFGGTKVVPKLSFTTNYFSHDKDERRKAASGKYLKQGLRRSYLLID
jgi:hypothetical protein